MKSAIIKIADCCIGRLIATILPKAPLPFWRSANKILLIRPGGIGDAVLLIPIIHSLRNTFPSCTIDILAENRNADVFVLMPGVNTVYVYDNLLELVTVLHNTYDVVIDTEQWHRLSAVVARLVKAPMKIGFCTNERRRMFTHCIGYDMGIYEPYNFASLLNPLGVDRHLDSGTLMLPEVSISKADQLLQPLCSEPFVVIFPGSSVPEKCLGKERFSIVAKQLGEGGYKVVVVGGGGDRDAGECIAGTTGLNLAGKTTLPETAAVIARSRLVICGDSGVLHIAAGLGVPTVSLFGPSSEVKWAPRGDNHVVLNRHLPCSPCSRFGTIPPCSINVRCMKEITPDEVLEAARRLLSPPPEQKI